MILNIAGLPANSPHAFQPKHTLKKAVCLDSENTVAFHLPERLLLALPSCLCGQHWCGSETLQRSSMCGCPTLGFQNLQPPDPPRLSGLADWRQGERRLGAPPARKKPRNLLVRPCRNPQETQDTHLSFPSRICPIILSPGWRCRGGYHFVDRWAQVEHHPPLLAFLLALACHDRRRRGCDQGLQRQSGQSASRWSVTGVVGTPPAAFPISVANQRCRQMFKSFPAPGVG